MVKIFTLYDVNEFKSCSVCQEAGSLPPRKELRQHLIDNHSKEALADLIVVSVC
jgi:hypothetical protein